MVPIRYVLDPAKHKEPVLTLLPIEFLATAQACVTHWAPTVQITECVSMREDEWYGIADIPLFVGPESAWDQRRPKLENFWGLGMTEDEHRELSDMSTSPLVRVLLLQGMP